MNSAHPLDNDDNDNNLVSFRCSRELLERIAGEIEKRNMNRSEFVRGALELILQYLSNEEFVLADPLELESQLQAYFSPKPRLPAASLSEADCAPRLREKHHHITRLDREYHGFQGFRVAICRNKLSFRRYFSSREYGHDLVALTAAISVRDCVLAQLELRPDDVEKIFADAMAMPPAL